MYSTIKKFKIHLLLGLLICMLPGLLNAQGKKSEIAILNAKIDQLSQMLEQLKSEQNHSMKLDQELEAPRGDFNKQDSLRLVTLQRKQAASSAKIDALTMDIIKLSRQLEDPKKRYALAKKLKEPKPRTTLAPTRQKDSSSTIDSVSARSVDLAAVKLIRQGQSLDQARLLTIEKLSDEQVLKFYRGLAKEERYKLYDIADDIVQSEGIEMMNARRSAIYFYLFTK
ncbi:MAG: hypothetical protein K9N35_04705 [Candidatus Marinimicrobia bacterium]|nr:hypothetical protein [Candidatus Neomarinimicrobiota bacterium]